MLTPIHLCALILVAAGLPAGLLAQQRISLDGEWLIAAEPRDEANSYDRTILVPQAFETALGTDFDGVAWYRRPLLLDPAWRGAVIRVEFSAVATHATVLCNGKECARHLGGWTPFGADLTAALRWDGTDVLEVRVDERVGHNTQGFLPIIQPHFGGIWQSVTLCIDRGPVLDPAGLFVFGRADGSLQAEVAVHGARPGSRVTFRVFDGATALASATAAVTDGRGRATLQVVAPRLWAPGTPHLYRLHATLGRSARSPGLTRSFGFRDLQAQGTRLLWNGAPLQVRGVLHWGYSPPHLAPPQDPLHWRRQLEDFRALGFNLVKCCLWVPPRAFYQLCDELGLLVWQEYPTWHPQMDQAHKQELLAEYAEFFVHDRSHPSVAFRSITCETGHGADLDVVQALYTACKAAVPDTLVVDDSSWIGWQRITDFWDEHPYGNNSWLPGRLAAFRQHIAERGEKPLLLGECIAADTWADRAEWQAHHGTAPRWWRPDCWQAQGEAEAWLTDRFGPEVVASLGPIALDYGLRNRKYQIERMRLDIADAGYVVSVARDFAKARMGLYDDFDRLKWTPDEWRWHGDTMVILDLPWDGRSLAPGTTSVPIRVAHHGRGPLRGELRLIGAEPGAATAAVPLNLAPGTVSAPIPMPLPGATGARSGRVRVRAQLTGSHPASNEWDLWPVPPWHYLAPTGVRQVTALDSETLAFLEQGGRVVLLASDRKASLRTEAMWSLRGAPFAPPHPLHAQLPAEVLLELQSFDLETGRVMPGAHLLDQVDPILAFWETHDIPEVRLHLLAFDCKVGKGRLLATALHHDSAMGQHALQLFRIHLAHGPAPQHGLSPETIAALGALLTEKRVDLPRWRFRTDPGDAGRTARWFDPATDASTDDWRELRAGSHWENQGDDLKHFTGVAWYRVDVDLPADWQGLDARAVFEGVDDSFTLWVDGEEIASFGDPRTGHTIWLERQVAELGRRLGPGPHTLVLRVVDHQGAGGLWKPVFLTTGPTGDLSLLLH